MTAREPFQRNQEGSRLYYDALSSTKKFYYTVEMLGPVGISCDCDHFQKGHAHCKHMTGAEREEKKFQEMQQQNTQAELPDSEKRLTASLLGTQPFSLNR